MDPQTIQAIATEVARHVSSYAWAALAIQVVFTVAAAAVAAFFGAYLKERGKNLATKDDFALLQRQLRDNTDLVETIKSEVAQRDWTRREWATLRRLKIEALLEKMNECRAYLKRHRDAAYEGRPLPEGDPITSLETIAELYLPELREETKGFLDMYQGLVFEGEKLQLKVAHASAESQKTKFKSDFADRAAKTAHFDERESSAALRDAARRLLKDIMDVEAPQ